MTLRKMRMKKKKIIVRKTKTKKKKIPVVNASNKKAHMILNNSTLSKIVNIKTKILKIEGYMKASN